MLKRLLILLLVLCALILGGCGNQAREWYETAELEELQNSHDHARRLYEKILTEYPDSEYAAKARSRLDAMGSRPENN